jgi:myo-inositol-1(or 4)-monophosphatase
MEYELFGQLNDSTRGMLRTGSASINICYVAAGRLQSAYGINNRIWDVAGPLAIAQKAGADIYIEVRDNPSYVNYVAGVPGVADKIAKLLKEKDLADVKLI